jgi:hypothetical protein
MTPRINIGTADHMDPTCSRLLFFMGISIKKSYLANCTTLYLQLMLQKYWLTKKIFADYKLGFFGEFGSICEKARI